MGLIMSVMGGGLFFVFTIIIARSPYSEILNVVIMIAMPSIPMLNMAMGTLYCKFIGEDIKSFDDFHIAILDIFNSFNSALPGKHYDVPSRKEVKECFDKWSVAEEAYKREIVVNFMKKKVKLGKLDDATLITGIVTPPAAMVVKRAGENVPQLSLVKRIPDVVFVPSATVVSLISVKFLRRIFQGHTAS